MNQPTKRPVTQSTKAVFTPGMTTEQRRKVMAQARMIAVQRAMGMQ